jgi:hypothetical protein
MFFESRFRKMGNYCDAVTQSYTPANKSASLPRNFEAGSNVIDTSESQSKEQRLPMTMDKHLRFAREVLLYSE